MFAQHPGFYSVSTEKGRNMLQTAVASCAALELVKTKKTEYINVPAAFDIETSSFIREDGIKASCMYIWQLGVNGYCFYGRTWQEFTDTCEYLRKALTLGTRKLVVYVHNLAYEFQFIKHRFEWLEIFAIRRRKPIYAVTKTGIEFRCSYIESGYSLAKVGENLLKYKVLKMEGDLYYKHIRHSGTPLTRKEMRYCENDIRVVMSHIAEEIETCGSIAAIPMTNTGRVRAYMRDECLQDDDFRGLIKKLRISGTGENWKVPDEKQYLMLNNAFRGGVVQANPGAVAMGLTYDNVQSMDITSSYPTVMISEKYPMSRGREIKLHGNKQLFQTLLKTKACVFNIEFINLRPKVTYCFYLDNYKSYDPTGKDKTGWIVENGKIVTADRLLTTITNVDYEIIEKNYEWDTKKIGSIYVYDLDYLPKPVIESVLTLYEKKTTLKGVAGKEAEYLHFKGMLNSCYGMIVTRFVRDEVSFDNNVGEWNDDAPPVLADCLEEYNRSYNRFLYYPWGVFVTAYARRNLFKAIFAIGEKCGSDFLYCDTDSVKYLHPEQHADFFESYNRDIVKKISDCLTRYGIPAEAAAPSDKKGKKHPLGVYDFDGFYDKFKTLGAKRYMCLSDGEYHLTVAGVPKESGMKMILRQAKNACADPFEVFRIGLTFSGRSIHHICDFFQDNPVCGTITDYLGKPGTYAEMSCIYMAESDYVLTSTPEYELFLRQLLGGWDNVLGDATH